MSFWDQIAELFRSAGESSPSAPTIHELIERTEEERTDFDRWMRTGARRRMLDWLMAAHQDFLDGRRTEPAIDFLDTPSSKGFVIHFHQTRYHLGEITHFFDYLRDRILSLEYRPQISDRRIFPRDHWVETQERHYLKPRNNPADFRNQEQRFGNIMLELELRDGRPWNLRLRATVYVDANYREARSFAELMEALDL